MCRPCARRDSRVALMLWPVIAVATVIALVAPAARGKWAVIPYEVPVDRLLKNANRYIQEHPKESQGYYVLGRLHSMAFATAADRLRVARSYAPAKTPEDPDALLRFWPADSILVRRGDRPTTPAVRDHLKESIRSYRRATELDSSNSLGWLGLGWVLEEASTLEEPLAPPAEVPPAALDRAARERIRGLIIRLGGERPADRAAAAEALARDLPAALPLLAEAAGRAEPEARAGIAKLFARYWQDQALSAYRRAYGLSLEADRKKGVSGPAANSLISLDAAGSIRRIFERRPLTESDRAELARIEEQTKGLPGSVAITPLIFSTEAARPLEDLLDPSHSVRFDLAGDGRTREWPWLRAETAMLVWDQAGTGQITSGRQLFGSVTWWIFWGNGYEPLALLDDDGDGWVAGRELDGLGVWRDRDGNGRSDPGEVVSAAQAGIARLAARSDGRYGAIPWNPRGLVTTDGRLLPTYDWTPTSGGASGREQPRGSHGGREAESRGNPPDE